MSDRLRELLVKAVRELSQAEQDEILGALLTSPTVAAHPLSRRGVPAPVWPTGVGVELLAERFAAMAGDTGDLKVLPVRLPVSDYERLRTWAREHQFSMAVIVRTLVERFLDGQAAAPAGGRQPPTPTDPA